MGDQPAAVARERAQQVELDRRQVDLLAVAARPRGRRGRSRGRPSPTARLAARRSAAPPQHRPQPRQQLLGAERLGDVVVGAGVERPHLLALVADRREDDDRQLAPARGPRSQTSTPLPSGSTRSRTIASGGRTETASSASPSVSAVRRPRSRRSRRITLSPRRICGSSSTTSTRGAAALMAPAPAARRAGRRRRTPSPSGVRAAAGSRPPLASTKPRQIARPRPEPPRSSAGAVEGLEDRGALGGGDARAAVDHADRDRRRRRRPR